jgi:hypothetical protein
MFFNEKGAEIRFFYYFPFYLNPTSVTAFSIVPVGSNVCLEHGLSLADGGKLPAFGLHQVEGILKCEKL